MLKRKSGTLENAWKTVAGLRFSYQRFRMLYGCPCIPDIEEKKGIIWR